MTERKRKQEKQRERGREREREREKERERERVFPAGTKSSTIVSRSGFKDTLSSLLIHYSARVHPSTSPFQSRLLRRSGPSQNEPFGPTSQHPVFAFEALRSGPLDHKVQRSCGKCTRGSPI